ncbi:DNA polymerase subunit Cdc27 [Halenospora varia]|nr:DNA polymerase subunit Cdc27 [Halenospora varia]
MLFEFHKQQNAKKPGTIHATYLVGGTIRKEPATTNGNGVVKKDGEDDYMQSSPFMSSSMPQPEEQGTGESGVLTITLVKEEDLDKVCSRYEEISSIHVYSIGPHPLKDLQALSDITREVQELVVKEDPLDREIASKYGTITNPNAKRRSARRPPPPPPVAAPAPAKPKVESKPASKSQPVKEEPKSQSSNSAAANDFFGKSKLKAKPTAKETSNPSSKESTPAPSAPTLKRDSSSIFKAFAKAKPKIKREGTDASSAAATEDEPMKDVDFDDDDDEEEVPVAPPSKEIEEGYRKARKEREAKLRAMMEESDEELEPPKKKAKTPEVEEEEEEPKEVVKEEEEDKPPVVSGGRKRGRRRVMKKSVGKDEEGYLVTKEVEAWESFSEDEPAPKPKPKASAPAPAAKKKGAARPGGQGNIMSFFGKK